MSRKECLNICLNNPDCLELQIIEILQNKKFYCKFSNSFCSFINSKNKLTTIYRKSDLNCQFNSLNTCKSQLFFQHKYSGYCLTFGGLNNHQNALNYCSKLKMHVLKLSDIQLKNNLGKYLTNNFQNITVWLGLEKVNKTEFRWQQSIWKDNFTINELRSSILRGPCFLVTLVNSKMEWKGNLFFSVYTHSA